MMYAQWEEYYDTLPPIKEKRKVSILSLNSSNNVDANQPTRAGNSHNHIELLTASVFLSESTSACNTVHELGSKERLGV